MSTGKISPISRFTKGVNDYICNLRNCNLNDPLFKVVPEGCYTNIFVVKVKIVKLIGGRKVSRIKLDRESSSEVRKMLG